ncbi:MAG TPA: response regulator [Verrucomicrobiae bacterium]|jgi:CheY-like chemotaxis protein|nr:response regulator [Verrucomicrobiae bacterium]
MSEAPAPAPRILVVEDEAIVAADIQDHLNNFGYEVVGVTHSGEEAVTLAQAAKPDLVLMDIILSGPMDGTEAAKIIRESLRLPVVFLTANSDDATMGKARSTDPFGYVLKPFEDRSLRIAIEIALYKHRAEREREELITKLQTALADIKTLQGMLPICAWCKKVRSDEGYWMTVDQYLRSHSDIEFSHGVCPTCAASIGGTQHTHKAAKT